VAYLFWATLYIVLGGALNSTLIIYSLSNHAFQRLRCI